MVSRTAARTLPLGIDIGDARVRVALSRQRGGDLPELVAVAARPRGDDLGRAIADAVAELQTRERRCILGIGRPRAILRSATFPPMRRGELERAARFEAGRWIDVPLTEALVRVVPTGGQTAAIGIAPKDFVAERCSAARAAKLRVIAIDDHGFALRRALPDGDAVLDIGLDGSVLYAFGAGIPQAFAFDVGGAAFTRAIVDALGTDPLSAERRKLAHGIAGSADALRDTLVEQVAGTLADCRADGHLDVRALILTGNGARLDDLATALERASAVRVTLATLAPGASPNLPPDVLRAAAPDWALAYGLSTWAAA